MVRKSTNASRRKILKGIGAGALSLSQAGLSGATTEQNGVLVAEYRKPGNPLTEAGITRVQQRAADRYRNEFGSDELVLLGGPTPLGPDQRVAGYAIKVYPDGTAQAHTSLVRADPEAHNVDAAHETVKDFVSTVKGASQPTPFTNTKRE